MTTSWTEGDPPVAGITQSSEALGKRLAIVVSHPTQYYSPWFQWLRKNTYLEFRVFYLWEFGVRPTRDEKFGATFAWDVDLLSGYDHEFVPNVAARPGTDHFAGLRNPTLGPRISAWKADAILIFGYNYEAHMGLILRSRLRATPLLFRGDSHLLGRGAPALGSRLALRILYGQFQAFLSVGAANHDYFRAFSVPEAKLFFAPHCVNAEHFRPTEGTRADAAALKASLGLGNRKVILFAGKFVPEKQPLGLLQAFLARPRADAALVFVGGGSEREAMEALASANPGSVIRFLPFANQSEMPSRYLLADLFVLPSSGFYETWGLAINEAMHMGVPCLVSNRVGCQRDLVIQGETGWVFDAGDTASLEPALTQALAELDAPGRRAALASAIQAKMRGYTYQRAARGLTDALASLAN